ncbi:MAG: HEPN domain-containing protein [Candidatus Latescibacterota bacterium]|jgi:HEPN domain-containing protein
MNESEQVDEVKRWLKYAQEDLNTAQNLSDQDDFVPRQACWFAQQSAEKALKAILIFLQIEFPFSHDLDVLCNLVSDDWGLKPKHSDLASLTEWAVESRYPGDWPEATVEDANNAVQEAQSLWQKVKEEFQKRDIIINS